MKQDPSTSLAEQRANYSKPRVSYHDYLQLDPQPGLRYEVLDGQLVKEASPSVQHQRTSRELEQILYHYFAGFDPQGELFYSPLDVTLGDYTVVQPDIFFISGSQRDYVKPARIDGPPLVVVEIVSPGSKAKDLLHKKHLYLINGVEHYWLVDPQDQTFHCFIQQGDNYSMVASASGAKVLIHPNFPGLEIPLAKLWK